MLAIALSATLFANVFINGVAFLIPTLHADFGLDLAHAALISAMPKFGMVPTLIAWGYLADRAGERFVLWVGSALTAAAALPDLSHACGLGTGGLFLEDVVACTPPVDGYLAVGPVTPDPARMRALAVAPDRRQWWIDRVRDCHPLLVASTG